MNVSHFVGCLILGVIFYHLLKRVCRCKDVVEWLMHKKIIDFIEQYGTRCSTAGCDETMDMQNAG